MSAQEFESRIWFEGNWYEDDVAIIRANDQAAWLAGSVFDGARAIGGQVPDIAYHTDRLILSAESLGLRSPLSRQEWLDLVAAGVQKFSVETALYVRLMVWARGGFFVTYPDQCGAALVLQAIPLPDFERGNTALITNLLRPEPEMAPTTAKASGLYPNSVRAMSQAQARGFDTAIFCDQTGRIAEMATSNICYVKEGVVYTPAPTGRFLNGITRKRVSALLETAGVRTVLKDIERSELFEADEVFTVGNFGKVMPLVKIEDTEFAIGPITRKAFSLYMDYAASGQTAPLSEY